MPLLRPAVEVECVQVTVTVTHVEGTICDRGCGLHERTRLERPLFLARCGVYRVHVFVVTTKVHRSVDGGGSRPYPSAGVEPPPQVTSFSVDCVQVAVVGPEEHRLVRDGRSRSSCVAHDVSPVTLFDATVVFP